jgi:hypothetical protein
MSRLILKSMKHQCRHIDDSSLTSLLCLLVVSSWRNTPNYVIINISTSRHMVGWESWPKCAPRNTLSCHFSQSTISLGVLIISPMQGPTHNSRSPHVNPNVTTTARKSLCLLNSEGGDYIASYRNDEDGIFLQNIQYVSKFGVWNILSKKLSLRKLESPEVLTSEPHT